MLFHTRVSTPEQPSTTDRCGWAGARSHVIQVVAVEATNQDRPRPLGGVPEIPVPFVATRGGRRTSDRVTIRDDANRRGPRQTVATRPCYLEERQAINLDARPIEIVAASSL